jgi:hypothetical protein
VLQDLAPNAKAKADFAKLFGASNLIVAGTVPWAWRERKVLAPARIAAEGPMIDLDDVAVIRALESTLAPLLASKGIAHLDISSLRSRDREVTQHISRTLFDDGASGLRFRSNCDDKPCFVVFEGRGLLEADGPAEPCTEDSPEFLQVCSELGLVPQRRNRSTRVVRSGGWLPVPGQLWWWLRQLFK